MSWFQLLACCAVFAAELSPSVLPTILRSSSEKILTVPAFGFFGPAQSDQEGDVFIHPAPFEEVNILKISPSSDTVVYKLPPDVAGKVSFYDYSVTPSGTVWALVNKSGSPELEVIEFSNTGEMKSPILIQMSDQLFVNRFVVLEGGAILIGGFYTDKASENLQGHSMLGVFDSSGRMVRNLGDNFKKLDLAKVNNSPQEGGTVAGDDGNAYLVDSEKILVISPGGEITKRITLHKPSVDVLAAGIYVSKGEAALRLQKSRADHSLEESLMVIDLATGKSLGWYVAPAGTTYGDVGFSRDEGFTFFANEQGQIKMVKTALQ